MESRKEKGNRPRSIILSFVGICIGIGLLLCTGAVVYWNYDTLSQKGRAVSPPASEKQGSQGQDKNSGIEPDGSSSSVSSLLSEVGAPREPKASDGSVPELLESEGKFDASLGKLPEARKKLEKVLSMPVASERQEPVLGWLVLLTHAQHDRTACREYFLRFKKLFAVDQSLMMTVKDHPVLPAILSASREVTSPEDLPFSELLVRSYLDYLSKHESMSRPHEATAMKMQLALILKDRGKSSESEKLLSEALQNARQNSDTKLIDAILRIQQQSRKSH